MNILYCDKCGKQIDDGSSTTVPVRTVITYMNDGTKTEKYYHLFCFPDAADDEPVFESIDDVFGDLPPRTDWQELRMAFTIWWCNLKGRIRNKICGGKDEETKIVAM